jgi:transcriptional regulator with XRE-family HTH domain
MEKERRQEANSDILQTTASKIRNLRKYRGLSQESVALDLGFKHDTYISQMECQDRAFSITTLWLLAQYFDIEIGFFLNPNLTFDDWFDETRRKELGIRTFRESPAPYYPYDVPVHKIK